MSLEKAVRATLVADSTVLGLVASRIYPQRRPQGTSLPALVYMNVHSHQTESLQTQTGIRRTRLAIESIGASGDIHTDMIQPVIVRTIEKRERAELKRLKTKYPER